MTPPDKTVQPPPHPQQPRIDANIDQDNPLLKARVAEFIESAGGEAAGTPKEKVEIQPNADFNMPNPYDTMLTEALVDTQKVDVTDEEKALFVKALLNDVPFRLVIPLMNGQFNISLRSRTAHEQRCIFDVLDKDTTDGLIKKDDVAYYISLSHKYCMALMVERINGQLFSEASIGPEATVAQAQEILHAAIKPKITPLQGIKLTAIQNAMRIFESKCAKLGTEAANQDFWKPRG